MIKPRKAKKTTFSCPDCGSSCPITTTKKLTDTVKEFHTCCSNDECGGRYVFQSEPVRVLIPSQTPNPKINLPCARIAPAATG